MNDKGQVYFASDKEVPQEDKARYQEACEQDVIALLREYDAREAECRDHSDSDEGHWASKGADLEALQNEVDSAARSREQKKE